MSPRRGWVRLGGPVDAGDVGSFAAANTVDLARRRRCDGSHRLALRLASRIRARTSRSRGSLPRRPGAAWRQEAADRLRALDGGPRDVVPGPACARSTPADRCRRRFQKSPRRSARRFTEVLADSLVDAHHFVYLRVTRGSRDVRGIVVAETIESPPWCVSPACRPLTRHTVLGVGHSRPRARRGFPPLGPCVLGISKRADDRCPGLLRNHRVVPSGLPRPLRAVSNRRRSPAAPSTTAPRDALPIAPRAAGCRSLKFPGDGRGSSRPHPCRD
jgi:hypothetical protein